MGLLRSVELPPGKHTVTLSFLPLPVLAGGLISLAAWLLMARFWLLEMRRGG